MKLSLSWLQDHASFEDTVDGLAATMVRLGHEVEAVETPRASLKGVIVGHILEMQAHPNADRLRLLTVDVGREEPLKIVCGASNMQTGDRIPVATVGTTLPNGLTIKKGRIRGEDSYGMCCSEAELQLADDADGLLILPADVQTGIEIGEYLGLETAVFELSITPNRGDCMSAHGLSRDLAADYDLSLKEMAHSVCPVQDAIVAPNVQVIATQDCPLYMARQIRGITMQDAPTWLQRRLIHAGMHPVNGVVDVLNYIMLDMGQPMHAFDMACLHGDIQVRTASAGEPLTILDGRDVSLEAGDLLISDTQSVLALAGIMGSRASGVTDATTDIMLESAFFQAARISLTRRHHGLVSEASMRFERGVDARMVAVAMERASQMIVELFGGDAGALSVCGDAEMTTQCLQLKFPASRIAERLGMDIPHETDQVLTRMGFTIKREDGKLHVGIPSYRHDVSIAEDMVEEYARIIGYDKIPEHLPTLTPRIPAKQNHALDIAVQGGFSQVISYAFIAPNEQRLFVKDDGLDVVLENPISESMQTMRRTLWLGMLAIARHNLNRQQAGLALLEQGRTYAQKTDDTYTEQNMMAWLITGEWQRDEWFHPARDADFFDLKGELERFLSKLGCTARFIADDVYGLQSGQSAKILIGRREVGCMGKVSEDVTNILDIDLPVWVAEINMDALPASKLRSFTPLTEYPGVSRDLVFLFSEQIYVDEMLQTARKACGKLLTDVRVFDRYLGTGVPDGQVSLGIRFTLQATDHTLKQEEADEAANAIIEAMQKTFSASLRE